MAIEKDYLISSLTTTNLTLVELLRTKARKQPDKQAYTFLLDDESEDHLSYAQLDNRASTIGALLKRNGAVGERVLLLYTPGLEFIAAFLGCLYSGAIAVPVYPPDPARLARTLPRLLAIANDAKPLFALTTTSILSMVEYFLDQIPELQGISWLASDKINREIAEPWQLPEINSETIALLQYTSGSTSEPKGVTLTHGNLLHNLSVIHRHFEHTSKSLGVIWLPTYHDMGLIGGVLQPLYGGFPVTLMSPIAFLQRPLRWLQTISRTRATTSGGPNFAYDLCVRKISAAERDSLDLSSWELAFNGAEPVRYDTMQRFAEAFAPCGFRKEAFYPCYGLAEATLMVSGGLKSALPKTENVDIAALEHNRVVYHTSKNSNTKILIGCGRALPDQEILIVDRESLTRCQPDRVGEIWVSSPSVAIGYWQRDSQTLQTFQAYLADTGEGPFLRTGDLGFLKDGELFITGRVKDVILIRGRNHYPQDIELTVEQSSSAVRPGCSAAFSIEVDGEEKLVIVVEVDKRLPVDTELTMRAIRQAISQHHELQVYTIALLKAGSIPKTSSGKIQRHACRLGFLNQGLEIVASSVWQECYETSETSLNREMLLSRSMVERQALLANYLQEKAASLLRTTPSNLDLSHPLSGLDSLMAIELKNRLESDLEINLSATDFLEGSSIIELANRLLDQLTITTAPLWERRTGLVTEETEHALSYGQQALWLLHRLAPESAAYNLFFALRIVSSLDKVALRQAFQIILDRHPTLRTTYQMRDGKPVQQINHNSPLSFTEIDASTWHQNDLSTQLVENAHSPFNLAEGPLLRINLFTLSPTQHILLVAAHHIAVDLSSFLLLIDELGLCYSLCAKNAQPMLEIQEHPYTDYVYWQTEMLANQQGEQLWDYWRKELAGELTLLELPTDRPRPPIQTYNGAACTFKLDEEITTSLKILVETTGVTLFTFLLAAFQTLLYRYSGQEDILVGTPASGRTRAEFENTVGYFINPLILRANLTGNTIFRSFLAQVRKRVLAALKHQDFPFPLLIERLQPTRDTSRSPLFQVMFLLQQFNRSDEQKLPLFLIEQSETRLNLGGLEVEPFIVEKRAAQFELELIIVETANLLAGSFQYNTDLFDTTTMERMVDHFQVLLKGILSDPEQRLSDLPLLTSAQQHQILTLWNSTQMPYPRDKCIHQLFEQQVERSPDAIALIFEDKQITYKELNCRANQLAYHLRRLGAGPDKIIGIYLERSLELVISILAVLKAGAAYLPIDLAIPSQRLTSILDDARPILLLTQEYLQRNLSENRLPLISIDTDWHEIAKESEDNLFSSILADNMAYLIYTSGSTGTPKGVMVCHHNLSNFSIAMSEYLGSDTTGVWLAVTNASFDISILELLWTLTKGFQVIINIDENNSVYQVENSRASEKRVDFSLFYFASDDGIDAQDKYRLLIEGAKFADRHGFSAVWTPERHFHAFGGLYPNPSVTAAALSTVTEQVQIRAGSVVLPLHNPIRVAEEWAVVDNLSSGRAAIAFASGWHANDFVFAPENYSGRKEIMNEGIDTVRKLWRGEAIKAHSGAGNEIEIQIFPRPIQKELPI
ncbi:MAG: MupA/Atu3671 family FMN-dependent luciferase-like monooxygenase, partial [Acidobacteriota bacterium]